MSNSKTSCATAAGVAALILGAAGSLSSPTIAQAATVYDFGYSGSIVSWVVPETGLYSLAARGADGGWGHRFGGGYDYGFHDTPGGGGALVAEEFELTAGMSLDILVGGRGVDGHPFNGYAAGAGGGGGGAFIVDATTLTPILVAGGGGGGAGWSNGASGSTGNNGPGGGGGGANTYSCGGGGGGGGFASGGGYGGDGPLGQAYGGGGGGGSSFVEGGAGGMTGATYYLPFYNFGTGGFGGGGGGGGMVYCYGGGGGGGGYTGGSGGDAFGYTGYGNGGTGGGSFLNGSQISADPLASDGGNGAVRISLESVPEPAAWALMIGGFGLAGAALRRRRPSIAG